MHAFADQEMIIEAATGLDYEVYLGTLAGSFHRVESRSIPEQWTLLAHSRAPESLPDEERAQLFFDAALVHTAVKAYSLAGWSLTVGGWMAASDPQSTPHVLKQAWAIVSGATDFPVNDSLAIMNVLPRRLAAVLDPAREGVRAEMDARARGSQPG